MAHLHTMPGGHDVTASAMIFRLDGDEPRMLVHLHRKLGWWLQPGGHVEHTEDPWQALVHEVREEAGFDVDQLMVCQPLAPIDSFGSDVPHPTPSMLSTHEVTPGHFHSDLKFCLIADGDPRHSVAEGESTHLRWVSVAEYADMDGHGADVLAMMRSLVEGALPSWPRFPATTFAR